MVIDLVGVGHERCDGMENGAPNVLGRFLKMEKRNWRQVLWDGQNSVLPVVCTGIGLIHNKIESHSQLAALGLAHFEYIYS